jgi:hypothetical protein
MNKQFALIAIALSALCAGTAVQAAEETYVPPSYSTLTRAQVQADLAAWRAAGLADESRGEQTPDVYSTKYRSAIAGYEHNVAQSQTGRTVAAR